MATERDCAGFGWVRVNFLHSFCYGAVFWICAPVLIKQGCLCYLWEVITESLAGF